MEDVIRFKGRIELVLHYTSAERDRLEKLAETYNSEYPTNHKKYFTTAADLMSRMRSTLSAYKKIVYEFRMGKHKRKSSSQKAAYRGRTSLMEGEYSKDMFGWDAYDAKVKELYDLMDSYLAIAITCCTICKEVIDEEEKIRQTPALSLPLYNDSYNNALRDQHTTIKQLEDADVTLDNDLVKAMREAADVEMLIADLYHMMNHDGFNNFVVSKALSDAKAAGIDEDELLLWGKDNYPQVLRVRTMLAHIMELEVVKEKHKGKLSGYFMMRFCYWCNIQDDSQHAVLLSYVTRKLRGITDVCKIGAIKAEKKKRLLLTNEEDRERQEGFNRQLDEFLLSLQDNEPDNAN
ncbi:MAG: hypothetical protein IJP46_03545 [Prevotella sp.]|nr:hypothetical protein [Prevotella sp.]